MTKELARYFLVLIDRDLHFSFNGIGLPNNACEWLENQLMQENFDKVEEFIKLRYTEKSEKEIKKKRKFRCMTIRERCFNSTFTPCKDCEYRSGMCCQYPGYYLSDKDKPYKTRNGKYVLIEVKE